MKQNKLACNATNSLAISPQSDLLVWGSGKHGLLGTGELNKNYPYPHKLAISRSNTKDDVFSYKKQTFFKVDDVQIGQQHCCIVAHDADLDTYERSEEFRLAQLQCEKLLYSKLRVWLCQQYDQLRKKDLSEGTKDETHKIQVVLARHFDCELEWPYAPISKLQELLFQKAALMFNEQTKHAADVLYEYLQTDPNRNGWINLKILRDLICGSESNRGVVFVWGLNDERCGKQSNQNSIQLSSLTFKKQKSTIHETIQTDQENDSPFILPTQICFDNQIQIEKVACGNAHSIALSTCGSVLSWGFGTSGCLGLGPSIVLQPTPRKLQFDPHPSDQDHLEQEGRLEPRIVQIASGQYHCLVLTKLGKVYSWGNGQGGRLGHGDQIGKFYPSIITALLPYNNIVQIACGGQHSAALTSNYTLLMWGVGLNGRLGLSTFDNGFLPEMIPPSVKHQIERVYLGISSSFGCCASGQLVVWGSGKEGKLGLELSDECNYAEPRKLALFCSEKVREIAAGPFHTLLLTEEGKVFAFGSFKDDKLGLPRKSLQIRYTETPTMITDERLHPFKFWCEPQAKQLNSIYPKFKNYTAQWNLETDQTLHQLNQIFCSDRNTFFVTNKGKLFVCGSNNNFLCGQQSDDLSDQEKERTTERELIEQIMKSKKQAKHKQIDDQNNIDNSEYVSSFLPKNAQKFLKPTKKSNIQKPVEIIFSKENQVLITHVSASADHCFACDYHGRCYAWGSNYCGKLGLDSSEPYIVTPTLNKHLLDTKVTMSACGTNHSLFLTSMGQVYSAGLNDLGQLGFTQQKLKNQQHFESVKEIVDNFYTSRKKIQVELILGLQQICYIACGSFHSCAISNTTNNTDSGCQLYTWGEGSKGQLGHAKLSNNFIQTTPQKVEFKETKVVKVACGEEHTLVLDTDSKLWYFGNPEAVGVNSEAKNQLEPKRLNPLMYKMQQKEFQEEFVNISAGKSCNFAIGLQDKRVYSFGKEIKTNEQKRAFHKIDTNLSFHEAYFKPIKIRAEFIHGDSEHFGALSQNEEGSQEIYTWGKNYDNQLGHFETIQSDVQQPKQLQLLLKQSKNQSKSMAHSVSIRSKNSIINQIQNKLAPFTPRVMDEDQDMPPPQDYERKPMFSVQNELKMVENSIYSEKEIAKISSLDVQLQSKFQKICTQYNQTLNQINEAVQDQILKSQDAVTARVIKFPCKIQKLQKITPVLPNLILQNRQVYECIWKYLQLHPCYLIKIISLPNICDDPSKIKQLVHAVYGQKQILDNLRVIKTLVLLAERVVLIQKELYPLSELLTPHRLQSSFNTIFKLIFENQSQNLRFLQMIANDILYSLIQTKADIPSYQSTKSCIYMHEGDRILHALSIALPRIEARFELLTKLESDETTNRQGDQLSLEVLSLLKRVRKYLVLKNLGSKKVQKVTERQIDIFLVSLVLEQYLYQIETYTYSDVWLKLWLPEQQGQEKPPETSDSGVPLFSQIKTNQSQQVDTFSPFQILVLSLRIIFGKEKVKNQNYEHINFLTENNLWSEIKNYQLKEKTQFCYLKVLDKPTKQNLNSTISPLRSVITSMNNVFREPLDFNNMLVQDMFQSSLSLTDYSITIRLKDLIFVQNILVNNLPHIVSEDFQDDPILILLRELQAKPLQADPRIENFKINLLLKYRILLQSGQIVKCKDCKAPVTSDMIQDERFEEAYHGRKWNCQKCQKQVTQAVCPGCQALVPFDQRASDLVFQSYQQEKLSAEEQDFSDILRVLPILYENDDLEEKIEEREKQFSLSSQLSAMFARFIASLQKKQREIQIQNVHQHQNRDQKQQEIEDRKAEDNCRLELLNGYAKAIEHVLKQQREHKQAITEHERVFPQLEIALTDFTQRERQSHSIHNQIVTSFYTGLGSEFLREKYKNQKQQHAMQENKALTHKMWAGQLNSKEKHHKQNSSQSLSVVATYPYQELVKRGVLITSSQTQDQKRTDSHVLSQTLCILQYNFTKERTPRGVEIELLHRQPNMTISQVCNCFNKHLEAQESLLEQISISKEALVEIRRNFGIQAVAVFGQNFQVRVCEFAKLLNELAAQSDVFGKARQQLVSSDDSDDEELSQLNNRNIDFSAIQSNGDWNVTDASQIQLEVSNHTPNETTKPKKQKKAKK